MRLATKIVFLFCLVSVTALPVWRWFIDPAAVDLRTVAAFVGAAAAPMGILTGAMAAKRIAENRNGHVDANPE